MLTYDSGNSSDSRGNAMGKRFSHPQRTRDGRTVDSTGAFLVGELERLDPTLHEPLAAVTWGRDIDLREDVTIADEVSSFTLSNFASAGGLGTTNTLNGGKSWIGKSSTQITSQGLDIAKIPQQLHLWGQEIKYTIPELESAALLGRPVDQQKFEALKLKHQMDIDAQVYVGDPDTGDTGLLNSSRVTNVSNVAAGASGSTNWAQKSPDEILADFNTALNATWAATGYAVIPREARLPPSQYGYIATQKVSQAGSISILGYLEENNLLARSGQLGGKKLQILPLKWLIGAGAGGTLGTTGTVDRMLIYTKEYNRVRYPMTLLQRTPIQYDGIYHKTTYYCRLGVTEVVYPETIGYYDGL